MSEFFIKTSDINTRDGLIASGFELVDSTDGIFTFINSNTLHFDEEIKDKITYSNILTV